MSTASPIRVVQLTPPGRAAIASIGLSGADGTELLQSLFHPASGRPLQESPLGRIVFGRWGKGEEGCKTGEEVVVARLSETNIEVHCHGGSAAVAAIVGDLCAAGAKESAWEGLPQTEADLGRADSIQPDPSEPDSIQDAARVALAKARTERTAGILLDQFHGALRTAIQRAIESIERGGTDDLAEAARQLEELLALAPAGLHLTEPWQIVLAGPPNVGKSTLINAMVGYQRAITYAQPGTTRDVVTATTAIDGWPVELSDTAGLRTTEDPIEAAGVTRAEERLAAADVPLLVFDLSQSWSAEQDRLVDRWPQAIVVHNKSDLASEARTTANRLAPIDRPAGLVISAQSGEGVDALLSRISHHTDVGKLVAGDALPFTGEQVRALEGARDCLDSDPLTAVKQLQDLLQLPRLSSGP